MVRTGAATGAAVNTISPFNIQLVPYNYSGPENYSDYGNALAQSHIVYARSSGSDVITPSAIFFPEQNKAYYLLITGNNAASGTTIPLNNIYAVFLKVY